MEKGVLLMGVTFRKSATGWNPTDFYP